MKFSKTIRATCGSFPSTHEQEGESAFPTIPLPFRLEPTMQFNKKFYTLLAFVSFCSLLCAPTYADLFMVQENPGTNSDTLLKYELGTNTLSVVGNIGWGQVRGLAYDATTDTLYGVSRQQGNSFTSRLLEVDPNTGVGTAVSTNLYLPTGSNTAEISVDQSGNLHGLGTDGSLATIHSLLNVSKTTGIASEINPGGITTTSVGGLAFDHSTGNLYGASFFNQLLLIDPLTGTETALGTMTGGSNIARIVFDQDTNTMYGVGSGSTLYTIDPLTQVATTYDSLGLPTQVYAMASITTRSVPEPTAIAPFVLIALGYLRTRGRRRV